MITNVKEEEPGVVKVDFIPSSPFCPIAFKLAMDIKNEALKVAGIKKVLVYCRGHMMEQQINEMVNKEQQKQLNRLLAYLLSESLGYEC